MSTTIQFVLLALTLTLGALALLFYPLWRPARSVAEVDRRQLNLSVFRDQLKELENDRDSGLLAGEDFESDDLMENSAKHAFNASGIIFLVDPLKISNVNSRLDEKTIRNSSSVSINKTFKIDAMLTDDMMYTIFKQIQSTDSGYRQSIIPTYDGNKTVVIGF